MSRALAGTLLWLLAACAVHAQESRPDRGYLVGGALAFQNSALAEVSTNICPGSELAVELNGGVLLLKWLAASAFGRVHGEVFVDRCVNGLHIIPDSGTVVFEDHSELQGYPYLSTGVRVTAFSGAPRGGAFRVYAGGEWLVGRPVLAPLLGFGLSLPLSTVLLVAAAEHRFISLPYDVVAVTYAQRQPIAEQREARHADAGRWLLRLGFELAVPGR